MVNDYDPDSHLGEVFFGTRGLLPAVDLLLASGKVGAALIVMYSAIDTVAGLELPAGKDVKASDFIAWCDRWLRIPSAELVGADWYAARCAVLHSYGAESAMSRRGTARPIGYRGGPGVPENIDEWDEALAQSSDMVIVAVDDLAVRLNRAVADYLSDAMADEHRTRVIHARLQKVFSFVSYSELADASHE